MAQRLLESHFQLAVFVGLVAIAAVFVGKRTDWRLLALAVLAFAINEYLSFRAFGLLPELPPFEGSRWNWSTKIYQTLAMLALLALIPAIRFRDAGVTLRQAPGSWRVGGAVTLTVCGLLTAAALSFPPSRFQGDWEALAFQLTMPSIQEELVYRGVLLLMLDRAFGAPVRLFGAKLGLGVVIAAVAFGLPHGLSISAEGLAFDWAHAGYTFVAALVLGWLRARTGSLLMPAFIHSYGNAIFYVI